MSVRRTPWILAGAIVPGLLALAAAHAADVAPTVGSVTENNGKLRNGRLIVKTPSILRVQSSGAVDTDPRVAIASYDRVIELSADPQMRAEAMRRAAYLRIAQVDAGDSGDAQADAAELHKAIAIYQRLLREQPDDPANDLAYYQLARAYQLADDNNAAIDALRHLGAAYPKSTLVGDSRFRAAELLYVQSRYAEAEVEYRAVLALGERGGFFVPAQYKLGWSLYKQSKYEEALPVFMAILERELPPGVLDDPDKALAVVAPQKLELAVDALRVSSLAFAALGGGKAANAYFAAHGEPRFATLSYVALGRALLDQQRYSDAAEVYLAFVERHPQHARAPDFQQRVIAAYQDGGFSEPLLRAKEVYAERYLPGSSYWAAQGKDAQPPEAVIAELRRHLDDLGHYHQARAQRMPQGSAAEIAARREVFLAAAERYRRLLQIAPAADPRRAEFAMLQADALFDGGRAQDAAEQYQRVAYDSAYADAGPRAPEAAFAAVQAWQRLAAETASEARPAALRQSVAASVQLADRFAAHPQWVPVLTRAAQDLYEVHDDAQAVALAERTLQAGKPIAAEQRVALYSVVADARFAQKDYARAEEAYTALLPQLPREAPRRMVVVENLATAIYRQAEGARDKNDLRLAATHFQRVGQMAPEASIRPTADYDAAAALIALKDWRAAEIALEQFRGRYPAHALGGEVDKKLAFVYQEDHKPAAAADAYGRVALRAAEALDTRREAAWQAAQLYDQAKMPPAAARAYESYLASFPQNLDRGLTARRRLADLARDYARDETIYRRWLQDIVMADASAAGARSSASKAMAAQASLEIGRLDAAAARQLVLRAPVTQNLPRRKQATETAIAALLRAANYGEAGITTAATYEIGSVYRDFGRALLDSERPHHLDGDAMEQYQILLEEQADPFERKAIEAHEANLGRIKNGHWDDWIHRSAASLTELAPGRYGKNEIREDHYDALP